MAEVVVWQGSQAVVVNQPMQVVVVHDGPRGLPGPPGASGAGFGFQQTTPAASWIINHNLGFRPAVELFTVGGVEFDADVQHTSMNQTVVSLTLPLAGYARLT